MATTSPRWQPLQKWKAGQSFCALAELPDGKLASGGFGCWHLWEPGTGKCLQTVQVGPLVVSSVIALTDGSLATCDLEGHVAVWNTSSGAQLQRWETVGCVRCLVQAGARMVCANGNQGISVLPAEGDAAVKSIPVASYSLALLADGTIASGSHRASVSILQTETWTVQRTLELGVRDKNSTVKALAQLSGGHLAAGGDGDLKDIQIVNLQDGSCTALRGHTFAVESLAQLPDCTLASGSQDKTLIIWSIAQGFRLQTLQGHTNWVRCLVVLQDGTLASGDGHGTIIIWKSESQTPPAKAQDDGDARSSLQPQEPRPSLHKPETEKLLARCAELEAAQHQLQVELTAKEEALHEATAKLKSLEGEKATLQMEQRALQDRCATQERKLRRREAEKAAALRPSHWTMAVLPQGWTAQPVDRGTLDVLKRLCAVSQPDELGIGRDAHEYDREYNALEVHCAWRIEDAALWARFTTEREIVSRQISAVPEEKRPAFGAPKSTGDEALPGEVNREVNEAWLLHGTKPEVVLPILNGGLNDRLAASTGAFGAGVYLAEDIEKVDQYTTPDPAYEADGLQNLHSHLFRAGGNAHPREDLFYVFVVRSICGLQLRTTGIKRGAIVDEETGTQLFMNRERRELVHVPGVKPPVSYHSLLCECGHRIQRFREFVLVHAGRTYIEYLVAYKRLKL